MNKTIKDKLDEFDENFLIKCLAHSKTSNWKCICDNLEEFNRENKDFRKFLRSSMETAYKEGEQKTITSLMLDTAESVGFKEGQDSVRLDEKAMEKILKELYNKDLIQEKGYFRPKNFGWLDMNGLAKAICKLQRGDK